MEEAMDWCMTKRYTFMHNSLFKLKQINEDSFILAFPRSRRINFYDFSLTPLATALEFDHEPQAIDYFHIEGREFVFAGLKNGTVEGREISFQEGEEQDAMRLRLEEEKGVDIYINDMLYLDEGKLVNCYNSGSIAIWDVSRVADQASPVTYLKKAHQDYVYKLRRVDRGRIVSCGNDQFTNIIDLQSAQTTDSYCHSAPVWCCYPVDENLLCSAGLMGYLSFRDLRSGNVVQTVQLLTSETSFVTRLDNAHLVFGDGRQISRCDLRMVQRMEQCTKGMKVSAESILVTQQGGVAVGRGCDLCLFGKGEQGQVEEKSFRPDNSELPNMPLYQNFFANILNIHPLLANNAHLLDVDSDEGEGEDGEEEDEQLSDHDSSDDDLM